MKQRFNSWYGCRRDTLDARDEAYRFRPKAMHLPSTADLREHCPPPLDQGPIGSCTAFAICAALRWHVRRFGGKEDRRLSELALYYAERDAEGTVKEDAGAEIRTGIKCARSRGVPLDIQWPYLDAAFARSPPAEVYDGAWLFGALRYERVRPRVNELRAALASGFPVVVGATLYSSFESDAVAQTGVVPMPNIDAEDIVGGHAMLCVGYTPTTFTVLNSWGDDWGDGGFCHFPASYLGSESFGSDYWLIKADG